MKKVLKSLSVILLFVFAFTLSACKDQDEPDKQILPTKIMMYTTSASVQVGDSATMTAVLLPDSTTNTNIIWSSSNTSVLKIEANGGTAIITGLAVGTSTVTSKSEAVPTLEKSLEITVTEKAIVDPDDPEDPDDPDDPDNPDTPIDEIDYAGQVKLDMTSSTIKQEVTVKTFVDGDTTHFYVPESVMAGGVIKARYLGINTPESTGKIEEYGKAASNNTKETLKNAVSIIIESDDSKLNADSTGGRYLLWVWYKTSTDSEYRNLNIEILQKGLAIASNSANNRYGETCIAAINQARALKLNVYSGEPDPLMYYGDAVELTLKELRCNIADYNGILVAFEAVVYKSYNNSIYMEEYDPESDMYYGITAYLGYSASGDLLEICSVGNRVRMVGTVQYYETGGTYQVAGLTYRAMKPDDPKNVQKISDGYAGAYTEVSADEFLNGKISVEFEEEIKQFSFSELAIHSSISMKNLTVKSVYTTTDEESSSYGAMTLTCEVDGKTVTIRTIVLYDENKNVVTEDVYLNKVINVTGVIDYFNGSYQIKVFSTSDITINK